MNLQRELYKKHLHGQEKYHAFSFLKDRRVMAKETIEELIDGINYQVYQLIKNRVSKKELSEYSKQGEVGVKMLNLIYKKIINSIPKMSNRSENRTIKVIARMRDLIKELSK